MKQMTRRSFLKGLGLSAFMLSGCGLLPESLSGLFGREETLQETPDLTLHFAMIYSGDSVYAGGAYRIEEQVRKYTKGRVALEVQTDSSFGSEEEAFAALKEGELDMCVISGKLMEEEYPAAKVFQRPFLFDSTDEANYTMDNATGALLSACMEESGVTLAGWMETGFSQMISMQEITSAKDLIGRSTGALNLPERERFWEAFGSYAQSYSASGQKEAFHQGQISVCENTASVMWANRLYQEAKNLCWSNHHFGFLPLCLSASAKQRLIDLGEGVYEAVLKAAREGCEAQWRYLEQVTDSSVTSLKENGIYFRTLSPEEKEQMRSQFLTYAEDPDHGLTVDETWLAALTKDKEAFEKL